MQKKRKSKLDINTEDMIKAGVHLGHQTSKLHPKMEKFVLGIRNTVHVIDLEKSAEYLKKALEAIEEISKEGKDILIVGTKIPLRETVREIAENSKIPCVTERWLGGTFTNSKNIFKRVQYYKDLKEKKAKGELDKYTKKERIKIEEELEKLEKKFGGIKDMEELPEAVFICDLKKDNLAMREAKIKKVKVFAICDTNVDPTGVDYPIPANDDALSSVRYILERVALAAGKSKIKSVK